MRLAASIISASVKRWLKLNLIAECNRSGPTPIACKTGDGNSDPLEQAEPVEQQIPARSQFIRSTSAWQPGKDTFNACGKHSANEPLTTTGAASRWRCSRKTPRNEVTC